MVPTIVYKCPGVHPRKGGTYDWRPAPTAAILDALVLAGYSPTLQDAVDAVESPRTVPKPKEVKPGVHKLPASKLTPLFAGQENRE